MAFKIFVFLAVLQLSLSAPDPNQDIEINVEQVVNVGGCCPENSCVLDGKIYPDQAVNKETCVELICNKGVWESQGDICPTCGTCEVWGDPHIVPFEHHNLTNVPWNIINPIHKYRDNNTGNMVISQPVPGSKVFGVHAEFEDCTATDGSVNSCVGKALYYEPGVKVQLILPKKLLNTKYCFNSAHWTEPGCSITEILVNGVKQTIINGAPATSFYETVLIFAESCHTPNNGPCQYIYVVGSKGYSVRLMVEPSNDHLYNLFIFAKSTLQNQIYGLCDVFTGETVYDGFTCRNRTKITSYPNLHEFTSSWEEQ